MIWDSDKRDPYFGDEIAVEMAGGDPDDETGLLFLGEGDDDDENKVETRLDEVLRVYECEDLIPVANRILWLSAVREALGHIPPAFDLTCEEIDGLVILQEELSKKMQQDHKQLEKETAKIRSQAGSGSGSGPGPGSRRITAPSFPRPPMGPVRKF